MYFFAFLYFIIFLLALHNEWLIKTFIIIIIIIIIIKAFRILGLNERKGRWVVEQDFHGNFGSMLHDF